MLTDSVLRKALPLPARNYRLTDARGLYIVLTPAGSKLWRYKYRFGGAEKLMTLGNYPDVSLASARERHAAARKLLAEGTDPMAQRKAQKVAGALADRYSFASVAAQWLAHWGSDKSPRHADTMRRRLEANLYPRLGGMAIAEIEAPQLVAMAKSIEGRGAGDLAKRSLQMTGQIFRYAIAHGYCARNPAADIRPSDVLRPTVKRNLARVDAKALPALLSAMEVYPGKVATRFAVKLMALSFVRTSELIGGRWDEIDWDGKRWNIPGERMKMKTPHIVPLSTQALRLLKLLQSVTGSGALMFPGDVDRRRSMSNNTILHALRVMGFGGVMTGHGFRGLASTLLHEQGWPHEHIELQLAHAPRNAVSAAYNHALYLKPRAEMMQAWGDYLENSLRQGLTS
jgi:integrase